MTIVYAEKLDDLIFVLADTFWERPLLGQSRDWRMEPLSKIVNLENKVTISFSGNADLASTAISRVRESNCLGTRSLLLNAHLASGKTVDFVLVDHENFSLILISDGVSTEVRNCHLGSPRGFTKFQELRHGESDHEIAAQTMLSLVRSPDGVSDTSSGRYSHSLKKFQQTLVQSNEPESDWGGFAVPFYLNSAGWTYGSYLENTRAPLDTVELSPAGPSAVPHNDLISGGYQIGFTGSNLGYAAHFVNGGFGFIYRGFEQQALQIAKYTQVNPYNFALEAEKIGCSSFGTWRSAINDSVQLYNFVAQSSTDGIRFLLKFREEELLGRISSSSAGQFVDFSQGVLAALNRAGEFELVPETLNLITFVVLARSELAKLCDDKEKWRKTLRELAIWQQTVAAMKFSTKFSFPSE